MTQRAPEIVHPWTFIAVDPQTGERGLIAEVHPEAARPATPEELRDFKHRLFARNVRVGLHVTPATTWVMRDLLTSMQFPTNTYDENVVDTAALLRAARLHPTASGAAFVHEVRTWLEAIATSWHSFLPQEAVGFMVPEVVGNLAQANLEVWDDVLAPDDAR